MPYCEPLFDTAILHTGEGNSRTSLLRTKGKLLFLLFLAGVGAGLAVRQHDLLFSATFLLLLTAAITMLIVE
jgi:hypothetical protein